VGFVVRLSAAPAAATSDFAPALVASSDIPIDVPGGRIELRIDRRSDSATPFDVVLREWVEKAGRAVAAYYGTYPVDAVAITIRVGGPGRVSGGQTMGEGGRARIRIFVGSDTTEKDLAGNWQLVHEMVHLAWPSMDEHAWVEEGLATYVEPLARARANLAPSEDIWKWLVWGLPKGLDGIRGRGIERSDGWDATYWGGALYCFLADVEIRQRTDNKKSLDDALRGILKAGGDVRMSWPLMRALKTGDEAVGVPVLEEMHAKLMNAPVEVDLPGLFKRLGVSGTKEGVVYDDSAPLAAIRRGITMGGAPR
jgi:hypothetical protein